MVAQQNRKARAKALDLQGRRRVHAIRKEVAALRHRGVGQPAPHRHRVRRRHLEQATKRRQLRAEHVAIGHRRQAVARGQFDTAGGIVHANPRGIGMLFGVAEFSPRGILRAEHGALRRVGVNHDVGQVAQHLLLLIELSAVALHGRASGHQHHLLERATRAHLVDQHTVRFLGHAHRRAHDFVLQLLGGIEQRQVALERLLD